MEQRQLAPLRLAPAWGLALGAVASFHAGYLAPGGWPMLAFPFALFGLIRLSSPRVAFYAGLAVGMALYAPHLGFFWTLFGPAAVLLWLVLAFWIAAFLGIGRLLLDRLPPAVLAGTLPFLWLGLEYFRSELYFLRFSWLVPGLGFGTPPAPPWLPLASRLLGAYGIGFLLALAAAWTLFVPGRSRRWGLLALPLAVVSATVWAWLAPPPPPAARQVRFAGAQIENVAETDLVPVLDRLIAKHPDAELVVLPEYSLAGEPTTALRDWSRDRRRHLIVGGREELGDRRFRNTAFVIDPSGEVVFRQAKSVPIQFFDDGLPAPGQEVWQSPWGRIGIAICYDLSYTRVLDRLVRKGAEALVVPTMDAVSWGAYQHALHARIAPARAAEYGVPIARVASSGISQAVDAWGRTTSSAPFADDVAFVAGTLELRGYGTLPIDRWLGPTASVIAAILASIALVPARWLRPTVMSSATVPLS